MRIDDVELYLPDFFKVRPDDFAAVTFLYMMKK